MVAHMGCHLVVKVVINTSFISKSSSHTYAYARAFRRESQIPHDTTGLPVDVSHTSNTTDSTTMWAVRWVGQPPNND